MMTASEESADLSLFHLEKIHANGITHRLATVKGRHPSRSSNKKSEPLIVLLHGWPEGWYSWRHQLLALSRVGFFVCAPDLRGFGGTDAPLHMQDYRVDIICHDIFSIAVHELGFSYLVVVGHDFGAYMAWHLALLHPVETVAVCGMSLPYLGLSPSRTDLLTRLSQTYGNSLPQAPFLANRSEQEQALFQYILHHNLPCADQRYDLNAREALYRIYFYRQGVECDDEAPVEQSKLMFPASPEDCLGNSSSSDHCHLDAPLDARASPGMWERIPRPKSFPDWLPPQDFDYMVQQYQMSGFRGGLNYYKVMNDNWHFLKKHFLHENDRSDNIISSQGRRQQLTPTSMVLKQPALFICGEQDHGVIQLHGGLEHMKHGLEQNCERLVNIVLLPDTGHWCQQEQAERVNRELIEFLNAVVVAGDNTRSML